MPKLFRIHGDNIVECERLANLIVMYLQPSKTRHFFTSLSCMALELQFTYQAQVHHWVIEMLPGFNKSRNDRWESNIFDLLKAKGSFLDETPDVILTYVEDEAENILVAIEFCSALQAGNQAWQRSGRAYSTGRTGTPYLYIVDFVKYELNPLTRERKALRFPNPAVPFSYVKYAMNTGTFMAQAYFRAEEFDENLSDFDDEIFAEKDVSQFVIYKMLKRDTAAIEKNILQKNMLMVNFLANSSNSSNSYTKEEWNEIYSANLEIFGYTRNSNVFKFQKKIAKKSIRGKVFEFNELVKNYSRGIASSDLPFGIIPKENKLNFLSEIANLYGTSTDIFQTIIATDDNLAICILKAFKPRGDDNRPDRGALPLIAMLAGEQSQILTFIYGPISKGNLKRIDEDINKLAQTNGLWKTFVALSDTIIIDTPIIGGGQEVRIIDNTERKAIHLNKNIGESLLNISNTPNHYQENDVDTILHYIFRYIGLGNCFEGMCNPPGGDWSGLSLMHESTEYRWLSLPRVSVDGKRPDHVIQFKNFILAIESKERKADLETDVGIQLKRYIEYLTHFTPSVQRKFSNVFNGLEKWKLAENRVLFNNFPIVSAGAYITTNESDLGTLFDKTNCDLMFELIPNESSNCWNLRIVANNSLGEMVKNIITDFIDSELISNVDYNIIQVEE